MRSGAIKTMHLTEQMGLKYLEKPWRHAFSSSVAQSFFDIAFALQRLPCLIFGFEPVTRNLAAHFFF